MIWAINIFCSLVGFAIMASFIRFGGWPGLIAFCIMLFIIHVWYRVRYGVWMS